ncbi:MAG TPA: hypothetical protein VKV04_18960 [Verrucomicrobiae bacterium]|nr:hypothetical protein [Verrucomicrobiae bacterium]
MSDPQDPIQLKLEACRFISETHRKARAERRSAHAQSFFTTLTFFAIVAATRFADKVKLPEHRSTFFCISAWILLLTVAVLAAFHVAGIHAANRVNRKLAEAAEDEVRRFAGLPDPIGAGRLVAQLYLWEVAMIIVFAIGAGVSLTVL